MTETESRPRNRALVASFLFTDLVGYSKGTASDQYAAKATLSEILGRSLAALRKDDYRIKDTGDGALIAFLSSPEHALYIALAIAHDFAHAASVAGFPSNNVRTGLHIGAVKEAIDLEARPNFVGDGINAAKRIMDFAAPGQITASRAYFEAVSWLDSEYAALFQHLGASDDKHGRPHELYAIAPSDAVLERLRRDLETAGRDGVEPEAKATAPQASAGASADEVYLSRIPINALISEAAKLYEAGNYQESLRYYESAAGRPEGQQMRVFNGLYLVNTQLGRADEAEKAFAKIVALGLATNSLSVKFLYRPGSLEFLADPKISAPYTMWVRLIGREVASSGTCLTIVGHTSKTGTEQFNERLSLQRAVAMQRRIEAQAPETAGRLQSVGMGFRENIVGSGTDDLRDALDRRVEFKVRSCQT